MGVKWLAQSALPKVTTNSHQDSNPPNDVCESHTPTILNIRPPPRPQWREILDRDILAGFLKMTAWFTVIFKQPTRLSHYKLKGTIAISVWHARGHWQYLCCHFHRAREDVPSLWFIKEWRHRVGDLRTPHGSVPHMIFRHLKDQSHWWLEETNGISPKTDSEKYMGIIP